MAKNKSNNLQNNVNDLELMLHESTLLRRLDMANAMGMDFNGRRDYNKVFGWTENPTYEQLYRFYENDGIGGALGDAYADETWRIPPIIHDGEKTDDSQEDNETTFLKAWSELEDRLSVYSVFSDADAACSYSRYVCLFLGYGGQFSQPLKATGKNKLAYITVLDEHAAQIGEIDKNSKSERFGLPINYKVKFSDDSNRRLVHHSRMIHILPYGHSKSKIYGRPTIKRALNYLEDLRKVIGASSEAFWLLIYRGMLITTQENFKMPKEGTPAYQKIQEQIAEYENGLRRILNVEGLDAKDLGGSAIDAYNQVKTIVSVLAGTQRMPQRILLGSERGELASTQDDANWADVIQSRQSKYSERYYIKPFIQAMITYGTLPEPSNGKFTTEWKPLFSLNEKELSEVASNYANAISTASGGMPDRVMPAKVFAKRHLNYTPNADDLDNPLDDAIQEDANEQPIEDEDATTDTSDTEDTESE